MTVTLLPSTGSAPISPALLRCYATNTFTYPAAAFGGAPGSLIRPQIQTRGTVCTLDLTCNQPASWSLLEQRRAVNLLHFWGLVRAARACCWPAASPTRMLLPAAAAGSTAADR